MPPNAAIEDIFSDLIEESAEHLLDEYRDFAAPLTALTVEFIEGYFRKPVQRF